MKTLISAIAFASVATLSLGTASADDTFEVAFEYAPAAPVASIHKTMAKTAKRACVREYRRAVGLGYNSNPVRDCKEDLLSKAVTATENAELAAFHGSTSN